MQKLDGKFHGVVIKNKDGSVVPQDQWIVFLAKDNALLPALETYRDECLRIGASQDQTNAVNSLIARVVGWRASNPGFCKVPDVQAGELIH